MVPPPLSRAQLEIAHAGVSKVLHNYQDLSGGGGPKPRPAARPLPVVHEGSRGQGPLRPPFTSAMASMAGERHPLPLPVPHASVPALFAPRPRRAGAAALWASM